MDDIRSEHPDEGTIHAWLDGALDEPTANGLVAHVATCGDCAERVAEARGLIAGASRVVRALDETGASAGPTWGQVTATTAANSRASRSTWRALRVTPLRAAIAATVLVALGVTFTSTRTALETDATRMMSMSQGAEGAPGAAVSSTAAQGQPARDAVFDSAIARNVAESQPPRSVGAASAPAVPTPAPARGSASGLANPAAATRVAAARGAMQEQRDSSAGFTADQLAASSAGRSGRAVAGAMATASARGDSASRVLGSTVASARPDVALSAPASAPGEASAGTPSQVRRRVLPGPRECYRVERASTGAGAWGPVSLPFVVMVNADGRTARLMSTDGGSTDATATLTRGGSDSLFLRLTRSGYEGTLDVGAVGAVRAGVMRSAPIRTSDAAMAVAGATARDERGARTETPPSTRRSAPSASVATPSSQQNKAIIMPATSIVARLVSCPA